MKDKRVEVIPAEDYLRKEIYDKDGEIDKVLECLYKLLWTHSDEILNLKLQIFPDWLVNEFMKDKAKLEQSAILIYSHWRMANVEKTPGIIEMSGKQMKKAVKAFKVECNKEFMERNTRLK